ncbi:MAG: NAD(+) diphosphatase [Betaproteobacteria bacterium]|nr:NAD(+) diphosphatase [Betaproteobacteria bacterium]
MILPEQFEARWDASEASSSHDLWFALHRGALLIEREGGQARMLEGHPESHGLAVASARLIGRWRGRACWAAQLDENAASGIGTGSIGPLLRLEPLRGLFGRLPDELLAIAARGLQLLEFDRTHRFCGVCASATGRHEGGRSRRCGACGETVYPRVAPAMMVLITRDGPAARQLLLARSPRFPRGMYSALAGFVEPSESIEACIHREAYEEVGVRLGRLRYFGSQSWPFPHSLMIAYLADYESGDIVCQEGEIEDARWFDLHALPQLPHRLSIARRLIEGAVAEVLGAAAGPSAPTVL